MSLLTGLNQGWSQMAAEHQATAARHSAAALQPRYVRHIHMVVHFRVWLFVGCGLFFFFCGLWYPAHCNSVTVLLPIRPLTS